ncbi:MAG: hypothetical protein N2512_03320, partial [Armatimonadetes bacterium]|nr:hypothetical protein [Armatimonadota bacterium]
MRNNSTATLLVRDYGSPDWGRPSCWRGQPATTLDLPFWEDSCLCRAMRLHGLLPDEKAAAEQEAQGILAALHKALTDEGVTGDQWQYFRQVLETHCVTPLAESLALVRHEVASVRPARLVAMIDVRGRPWWTGQAWGAMAARQVAAEVGLPAEILWVPAMAGLALRATPRLFEVLRSVLMRRRGREILRRLGDAGQTIPPSAAPADVLLMVSGPVVESLAVKLADRLGARGVSCQIASDPLAPGGKTQGNFQPLGALAPAAAQQQAVRLVADGPRRAARVAQTLRTVLPRFLVEAIEPRLVALECRERPALEWLEADAQTLLDVVRPKVVVSFHLQPRIATPYLVEARRRGIRTVFCQHGLMAPPDYESPWFDRCLVFNEYSADLVRPKACGADVIVVGNPSLDELMQNVRQEAQAPPAAQAAAAKPVVLVATQPNDPPGSEQREDWWFSAVARACEAVKARVQVKLHPQQSPDSEGEMYWRAMVAAGAEGEVIPHGAASLAALIAACDVFISQFSTSILDAIVLGKPAIFIELRPGPPFYPFDDFGAARRITDP